MADKKPKRTTKKQRRSLLDRVDKLAVALYWLLKIILLLWDRFSH